ncbi:MAG: hypothetical protein ACM32E_15950 [Gemmatimonadota bacterium]
MSRRTVAVLGAAAVAVGGVLGGAYITHAAAKINLSASSMSAEHHRHNMGMSNSMTPTPMASSTMGGMTNGGMGTAGMNGNAMNGAAMTGGMMTAKFSTLDNAADPTFNQLLGINNGGRIAGYFGSGAQGHPNKGYLLFTRNGMPTFQAENFPNSVQTQVTGLNDRGVTVGFYSPMNNANMMNSNFGFYAWHGRFHTVRFPTGHPGMPPVDQLLGVNNFGIAVGFYTNSQGTNFGYLYNIRTGQFRRVTSPRSIRHHHRSPSLTATAINNRGDVAGFYDGRGGVTKAFLKTAFGNFITIAYPGAAMTQAFGVNDRDEVVGAYTMGMGNNAKTFGFTWTPRAGFMTVSAPMGQGGTTINGVNDLGDLVGFYTDTAGNTHGLLVLGRHHRMPTPAPMMPTPSMTPSMMGSTPPMMPSGQPMTPAPGSTSLGSHS